MVTKLSVQQCIVLGLHQWWGFFYRFEIIPYPLKRIACILTGGDIAFAVVTHIDPDEAIIESVYEVFDASL